MTQSTSILFHRPSHAFADMLGLRVAFKRMSQRTLFERLNAELSSSKLPQIRWESALTDWRKGRSLPKSKKVVDALSGLLDDPGGDLSRAYQISDSVISRIRKLKRSKTTFTSNDIEDPPNWLAELCVPHLHARLSDPAWSGLLTALLLSMPDNIADILSVPQSSFGCFSPDPLDDARAQKLGTPGADFVSIGSSAENESVKYLAMNLLMEYGCVVFHRDPAAGLEYSVATQGHGIYLVEEEGETGISVYPMKPGSSVGYGASLSHAVLATSRQTNLALCHFCFPYRSRPKTAQQHGPSVLNLFSSEPIKSRIPHFAQVLLRLKQVLMEDETFCPSPSTLRGALDQVTNVKICGEIAG